LKGKNFAEEKVFSSVLSELMSEVPSDTVLRVFPD
jgi:hypothetical protein